MTREQHLENAVIGESERVFGGLTVRKITPRDEILFGRVGCDLLALSTLKKLSGEETGATDEVTESIVKAVFVCSQDPFRMLRLSGAGKDIFETAFFEWLGTVERKDLQAASAWILESALEIAAATFEVLSSQTEIDSKNAPSPAVPPLSPHSQGTPE